MRFLLDENIPKAAIPLLDAMGHQWMDLRGTKWEGLEDSELFSKAQHFNAVLLTTDRDFFHTIPHLFEEHCGVVVIALRQPNRDSILSRLRWILQSIHPSDYRNRCFQLRDHTWIAYPPIPATGNES